MSFFLVWVILAVLVGVYADKKGRSGVGFFFLSLLLSPLIGFLVALVADPRREKMAANTGMKKCPDCGEYVRGEARICRFCRHQFSAGHAEAFPGTEPTAPQPSDFDPWSKEASASESASQTAVTRSSASANSSAVKRSKVIPYLIGATLLGLVMWLSLSKGKLTGGGASPSSAQTGAATPSGKPATGKGRPRTGEWDIGQPSVDPITGTRTQFLSTGGTPSPNGLVGALTLCFENGKPCRGKYAFIYINTPCWVEGNEPGSYRRKIQLRFDNDKPITENWGITDDHKGVIRPRSEEFFSTLEEHNTLLVRLACGRSDAGEVMAYHIQYLRAALRSAGLETAEQVSAKAAEKRAEAHRLAEEEKQREEAAAKAKEAARLAAIKAAWENYWKTPYHHKVRIVTTSGCIYGFKAIVDGRQARPAPGSPDGSAYFGVNTSMEMSMACYPGTVSGYVITVDGTSFTPRWSKAEINGNDWYTAWIVRPH